MLTSELQMEPGIDLVLREKQTGEELASIDDMLTAVDNGEGVLVQFIEINKVEDEPQEEEEQKSDYSEDAFDEEEKPVTPRIMRVPVEKVKNGLKEIRMKLMIKKVPYTHMAKYMLENVELAADEETGLINLSTS